MSAQAAVGFRVKSGWATAVLLVGPARAPRVADRRVIELSDPAVPTSPARGAKLERRLRSVVARITRRSVRRLLHEYRRTGHAVRRVALVVGSDIDPARIANDHIRAHALEGRLFRTVLERACRSLGLRASVLVERQAYPAGATALHRSESQLKRAVTELGRAIDGPWRADEKTAALAAWMTLR